MTAALTIEAIKARCEMTGDCWMWTGAKIHGTPYIAVLIDGRRTNVNAQKHVLRLAGWALPAGARVRESCKNPMCLNPAHLERIGHANALKLQGNPFANLLALAAMP